MQQTVAVDSTPPVLLKVEQFAAKHPAWSPAAMRSLILHAAERKNSRGEFVCGNGLDEARAIIRLGRRVLIDEAAFFRWIASQQKRARAA